MSTIKTNAIQTTAGKPILNSTGSILQVVSTLKTDEFTTTSNAYVDVTGVSASITPSSTSSKILIIITIGGCANSGAATESFRVFRGATWIAQPASVAGNGAGSFVNWSSTYAPTVAFNYLDSPGTTSATTYKLQMSVDGGTGYFNRHQGGTGYNSTSSLTLMEISG